MVLKDVDYILQAHFEIVSEKAGPEDTVEKHYNIILRRLRKGQHFHAPCLGTREFGAQVDLVEESAIPPSPLEGVRELGWMLYDLDFSNPQDIRPCFFKATLRDGVLDLTGVQWVR
jgi:CRISPR-associated protein Cas5d